MNSRRKFLLEGSLATTALLASRPLTTLAKYSNSFSLTGGVGNSLTILHTGQNTHSVSEIISSIKKEKQNVLLLNTGNIFQSNEIANIFQERKSKIENSLNYDAVLPGCNDFAYGADDLYQSMQKNNLPFVVSNYDADKSIEKNYLPYRIIQKGNIKVGIIATGINLNQFGNKNIKYINPLKTADKFAAMLKNDHGCNLVVCLSHLGNKNKHGIDDVTLAKKSTCIDIIASSNPVKSNLKTSVIVHNKNKHEVIINSCSGDVIVGNINISFDESGHKKMISFNNAMAVKA